MRASLLRQAGGLINELYIDPTLTASRELSTTFLDKKSGTGRARENLAIHTTSIKGEDIIFLTHTPVLREAMNTNISRWVRSATLCSDPES